MLSPVTRTALHHPRLAAAAGLVLLAYAAVVARGQRLETFPALAPAEASVETPAPGMVAEQVEQLVTRPIENALIGARGVAAVHSRSVQGLSVVTLDFQQGAAREAVRQAISEGLAQGASTLPAGVGPPRLSPLSADEGALLEVGFTSDRLSPMALRDLVQWTVRPRLLSVPGVADVQVFGGETRRIEVRARAGDLSDSDLGYADVFAAVRQATGVAGAGFIDTPTQRIEIDPRGQALTPTDVAAGQIQVTGSAPVRISDVADVVDAPAPAFGDALIMGRPGVVLSITGRYGADTVETSRTLEAALGALAPALQRQGVTVRADLDHPSDFIEGTVRSIVWELLAATALIAVLLAAVLRDWRAAGISILGLPLSLLATVAVLQRLGWTLNTMTLGGLAVALGLAVDDAVIDVESIVGRLRDAEARHASRTHAVLMASRDVRAPVVYVTLVMIVALIPVMLMGGVQGALLRPLAVTVAVASLVSLGVAALFTPALALLGLNHIRPEREPGWLHGLKDRYEALLVKVDSAGGLALGAAGLAILAAAAVLFSLRTEFLPHFHGDRLSVEINAPPATSMAAMKAYGARITADLLADPAVAAVAQRIGRAETGSESWGPDHARFDIALRPGLTSARQDGAERRVRQVLAGYPGLRSEVGSDIGVAALNRSEADRFQVRIYGGDLDALDAEAARVADVLRRTPGIHGVALGSAGAAPVVRVDLNFQRLAIYGLSGADVLDTVQTAFIGRDAAQIYQDGRAIDVAVTAQAGLRQDPEQVGDLLLRSSSGVSVPLKRVADVYLTDGRTQIEHEGALRSISVTADMPAGGADGLKRLEARIEQAAPPPAGIFLEVAAPRRGVDPDHSLMGHALLAGAGIVALLLIGFGDVRASALVLGSILFALVGGVAAVVLTGGVLSLGAMMGLFALFGLSARNAALLVTRADELASREGAAWSAEGVRRAARDRVSPMAISAMMVAVAVAPFAIRSAQPGHEILGPMAIVILGGLASSTLLSLFVLPAAVFRLRRPRPRAPQAA